MRSLFEDCVCITAFCPSVSELSFLSFVILSFPSGGCSLVGKVVVFDLEANLFLQCSPVVKSIFWTSRHEFLFPLLRVLSFM